MKKINLQNRASRLADPGTPNSMKTFFFQIDAGYPIQFIIARKKVYLPEKRRVRFEENEPHPQNEFTQYFFQKRGGP
jgi:hypothetical protein